MSMSKVYLLNVPLESDYQHTLYFGSKDAQASYFQSKVVKSSDDMTYQRKDHIIRYPAHVDSLMSCNYVMYQNTNYNNKWFYAFIIKKEYINDGMTAITIATDVIQTWMFDYTVRASFIEREHVTDDTIGVNTVPEGLETGEYIVNSYYEDTTPKKTCIVMATTVKPESPFNITSYGGIYNGIYSGVKYYTYDTNVITSKLQDLEDASPGSVSALFIAPTFLCPNTNGVIKQSNEAEMYSVDWEQVPAPTKLHGYTPKNKKVLTYPYCYLLVTNACGGTAIYHYEFFYERQPWLGIMGSLTPGCSVRLAPLGYKNKSNYHFDEGVTLGKYPQCNWATDHYTNWLTQNGTNVASGILNGGAGALNGAVQGGLAGAGIGSVIPGLGTAIGGIAGAIGGGIVGAIGGLTQIANSVQSVQNADMVAPQVYGNINTGDVITSMGDNTFHFYGMTVKKEYAQIIDNYFSMYGYKINRVKVPNKNHRENYWFTKTINANITGAIPNEDMELIKTVYNNGVTFWKNTSTFRDYTVSNNII